MNKYENARLVVLRDYSIGDGPFLILHRLSAIHRQPSILEHVTDFLCHLWRKYTKI